METCERCGAKGPVISEGPFAGSRMSHDYCEHCSMNLCETCMDQGRCSDSPDHKHKPHSESEDDES